MDCIGETFQGKEEILYFRLKKKKIVEVLQRMVLTELWTI